MLLIRLCDKVVWIACLGIVVGFFLPWVRLQADLTRPIAAVEQLGFGHLAEKIRRGIESGQEKLRDTAGFTLAAEGEITASGYDIPRIANDKDARLVLALSEMFFEKVKDIDKKSYAVYAVPGLALLLALLYQFLKTPRLGRLRTFPILVALVAGLIAFVAYHKITHTDLDHLVARITIERGLWLSVWGYALMSAGAALAGFVFLFISPNAGKKQGLRHTLKV